MILRQRRPDPPKDGRAAASQGVQRLLERTGAAVSEESGAVPQEGDQQDLERQDRSADGGLLQFKAAVGSSAAVIAREWCRFSRAKVCVGL